jgi:ssDNA-binding Zn-finger/Zn-ribbon topoisomerase 1
MTEQEKREKVIRGLECCMSGQLDGLGCSRVPCPYNLFEDCEGILHRDALALLKAQEPVMVEERADTNTINCPECGQRFARVGRDKSIYLDTDEEPNYCPKCGKAVKWE